MSVDSVRRKFPELRYAEAPSWAFFGEIFFKNHNVHNLERQLLWAIQLNSIA